MDLLKRYEDSNGNQCNILQMINREPEWAANRIQAGESVAECNAEMMAVLKDIYRVTCMTSKASHKEQMEIFQRMRVIIGVSI
jgi:hypothetical protein